MKRLIIFGCGNFARVAHYYFERDSEYFIIAFSVDADHLKENSFQALPVVPFEQVEDQYSPDECHMFVALGEVDPIGWTADRRC